MLFWIGPSYLPAEISLYILVLLALVEKKNKVKSFHYLWEEGFKSIIVINRMRQVKCVIQYIIML